ECAGADGASRNAERTRKRDAEMRETPADPGAVHERPLRRRLSVADAGDVVDVTVDPFENGHHAATPSPEAANSRPANRMNLSDGQKRLGSRNRRTSFGS